MDLIALLFEIFNTPQVLRPLALCRTAAVRTRYPVLNCPRMTFSKSNALRYIEVATRSFGGISLFIDDVEKIALCQGCISHTRLLLQQR